MPSRFIITALACLMMTPAVLAESKDQPAETQCYTRQDLSARAAGFIDKVYVRDGQKVKVGELLAEMDHRLLSAGVREAEAGVAAAKAQLSLADDAYSRLKKMAASASSQEIFAAQMKAEEAKAQLAQAKAVLERSRIQLNDAYIRAEIDGHVSGLPRVKGLFVQAGHPLGHVEAETSNCDTRASN